MLQRRSGAALSSARAISTASPVARISPLVLPCRPMLTSTLPRCTPTASESGGTRMTRPRASPSACSIPSSRRREQRRMQRRRAWSGATSASLENTARMESGRAMATTPFCLRDRAFQHIAQLGDELDAALLRHRIADRQHVAQAGIEDGGDGFHGRSAKPTSTIQRLRLPVPCAVGAAQPPVAGPGALSHPQPAIRAGRPRAASPPLRARPRSPAPTARRPRGRRTRRARSNRPAGPRRPFCCPP